MSSNLSLHTYNATPDMQRQLLQAAVSGAGRLHDELGPLSADEVHLYIYDSTDAMREAILFEPQWTGGMAFAEYRTIILGISEQDLEWGLDAVEHELAHVIVGNLVSACYSRLPNWLSEGLAMVAEGGLDAELQAMLDQALEDDTFYPVRALTDSFTEDPSGASLSYAQSYSLVTYLLEEHGRDRLLDLLGASQAGSSPDSALMEVVRIRHRWPRPGMARVDRRACAAGFEPDGRSDTDRHAHLPAAGRAAGGDHGHAHPV